MIDVSKVTRDPAVGEIAAKIEEKRASLLEACRDADVSREVMTWRCGLAAGVAHSGLAAVDAVLRLHARYDEPVCTYGLDLRCEAHEWTKREVQSDAEVDEVFNCPDCGYRESWGCSHCEDRWPCPTVRAIMDAL